MAYATDLRTRQHTKRLELQARRVEAMAVRGDRMLYVLLIVNDGTSRECAMLAETKLPAVFDPTAGIEGPVGD